MFLRLTLKFCFLGGAIYTEGFPTRQLEFENFERKFEVMFMIITNWIVSLFSIHIYSQLSRKQPPLVHKKVVLIGGRFLETWNKRICQFVT